jgi:hypothetical protein
VEVLRLRNAFIKEQNIMWREQIKPKGNMLKLGVGPCEFCTLIEQTFLASGNNDGIAVSFAATYLI